MATRNTTRSARKPRVVPDEEVEVVGDGAIGRLVDHVADNPAMSSGLAVMALTIAAVVSNAMFMQKSRHPEPLFMTRPAPVAAASPSPETPIPDPRPRAEMEIAAAAPAPARDDVASVIDEPVPVPEPAPAQAATDGAVITELQRKLAERGLYDGQVDGISGARTRAAIVAYQKAEGLEVTGEPTVAVLDHINTASVKTAAPAETVAAAEPEAPPPAPVAEAPAVEKPAPVAAETGDDAVASAIELATRNRYVAVQRALNLMGYGPVPENGLPGDEIANAVRRFELDNGLPITGKPDDQVVERLVSIGAMQAI